jgi:uncharacterized protein GlcG (DUF336 family)
MVAPLTLREAREHADRAIRYAEQQGIAIAVAVVDEGGQLLQLDRMDAAALISGDLALAKASTAAQFGQPTSAVAALLANNPEAFAAMRDVVQTAVLPVGGGVPIVQDGQLRGAVGVSGGRPEDDERVATAVVGGD